MLPMRTSTIFKSRWWALIWAAGIIWTALDVAGSPPQANAAGNNAAADEPTDATGAAINPDDAKRLQQAIDNV